MVMKIVTYPRRCFLTLCGLLLMLLSSRGQVVLQRVDLVEHMMGPRTFFQASVNNPGGMVSATIEGDVRSIGGEVVLAFRSASFQIPSGFSLMGGERIPMVSYVTSGGEAGRSIRQFQRLLDGHYDYCFRLRTDFGELQDEYCDRIEVKEFLYLDLVAPWNGDTIEDLRPALSWTLGGSPIAIHKADVRLVLTPGPDGKSASAALASERPLFILPHVKDRTVGYPLGMPDLEPGKCYAWQAERMEGMRVIDRSEPWRFCIARRDPSPANRYIWLGKGGVDPIYEVTDDRIHFRYDEPYASARLDCTIKGSKVGRMTPAVKPESVDAKTIGQLEIDGVAVRSVGVNLYELDLSAYALMPGIYELLIKDEKQRAYMVRFRIVD
ncbi:MAG: hypothetical protein QM724_13410 [Flavobacteriales bacterium]